MNERIKELIKKVNGVTYDDDGNELTLALVGKELEIFTVLVVKETIQVVANNLPSNTYLDVADAVIEHFKG